MSNKLFISLLFNTNLYAQIVTDGTLGPQTNLTGPNFEIPEKLGFRNGGNLFHSFSQFNIGPRETATFSAETSGITSVISRVTGGQTGIYGTLESTIPNADFYLINPAGIIFGPDASLNVQGSFHASTANVLHLEDGGRFDASNADPGNNSLTVAKPVAFGFLDNPGKIKIDGSYLRVCEGKDMSFIGGDVSIKDSALVAYSGKIKLAAVASKGTVKMHDLSMDSSRKGTIELQHYYDMEEIYELERPVVYASVNVNGNGGQIFIHAGHLTLDRAARLYADAYGDTPSLIDIDVEEGDMVVSNSSEISIWKWSGEAVQDLISIKAKNLRLSGVDESEGGELSWWLTEGLKDSLVEEENYGLSDEEVGDLLSSTDDILRKGPISWERVVDELGKDKIANQYRRPFIGLFSKIINSNRSNLKLTKAAGIQISASTLTIDTGIIESFTIGSGDAGDITIDAEHVALRNFGYLNAAVGDKGSGQGGNITVNATESISLSGSSTISVSTAPDTSGNAGEIFLKTPSLKLDDHAEVNSFSDGTGKGGPVNIEATDILLTGKSAIQTKAERAIGGDINLTVHDYIASFNSTITAESRGPGSQDNGGNLTISNLKILALEKSALFTRANGGYGGNITVPENTISLGKIDKESIIERRTFAGQELNLDTLKVERDEVVKDLIERRGYSVIDSTSLVNGKDGILRLPPLRWEFVGLLPLPPEPPEPPPLRGRCSFSKDSRFTITARDILPRCPEDLRTQTIRLGNYY